MQRGTKLEPGEEPSRTATTLSPMASTRCRRSGEGRTSGKKNGGSPQRAMAGRSFDVSCALRPRKRATERRPKQSPDEETSPVAATDSGAHCWARGGSPRHEASFCLRPVVRESNHRLSTDAFARCGANGFTSFCCLADGDPEPGQARSFSLHL